VHRKGVHRIGFFEAVAGIRRNSFMTCRPAHYERTGKGSLIRRHMGRATVAFAASSRLPKLDRGGFDAIITARFDE